MLIGLTLSFGIYLMLAMGECLPRDGSAHMHACDASRRLEFRAFPLLVLVSLVAGLAMSRKRSQAGLLVLAASPFLSLGVVLALEHVLF